MLLGSAVSALVSVGAYSLYTSAWPVPGPEFPAPTAEIWLDMADLVSHGLSCFLSHTDGFCEIHVFLPISAQKKSTRMRTLSCFRQLPGLALPKAGSCPCCCKLQDSSTPRRYAKQDTLRTHLGAVQEGPS